MEQISIFCSVSLLSGLAVLLFNNRYNMVTVFLRVIGIVSGVTSVSMAILLIMSPFKYELHLVKRNALISTLEEARYVESHFEKAGAISKVIMYNQELAERQYENTLWLFDPAVDDRFMELTPVQ